MPGSSSAGLAIAAPVTANAKGAWTSLVGATARDAVGIMLSTHFTVGSGPAFGLMDIGIGPNSGAVTTLIGNLPLARRSTMPIANDPVYVPLPYVPAGSQLWCRYQSDVTAGAALTVGANLMAPVMDDPRIYGISADYGAIAGTSRGTQIDPGTTANTKPTTYTQLAAAAPFDVRWALLSLAHDQLADLGWSWRLDLAVGAPGAEVPIVADMPIHSSSAHGLLVCRISMPFGVAAGERIALRAQSNAVNTSRLLAATLNLFG